MPLQIAENAAIPFVIIFLFEPSLQNSKDSSLRHLQFQYHSILDFNKRLNQHGKFIHALHQDAQQVFEFLASQY